MAKATCTTHGAVSARSTKYGDGRVLLSCPECGLEAQPVKRKPKSKSQAKRLAIQTAEPEPDGQA